MIGNLVPPKFLAVDFYCGAGGTTRGLLDAGAYVIAGIDNDSSCLDTYVSNNQNTTLDCDYPKFLNLDMLPASTDHPEGQQHLVWDELKSLIPAMRLAAPNAPLLFAVCAPCQAFTKFIQRQLTTGRRRDRERDRNLLLQSLDFIDYFSPEMVISENVIGIKTGPLQHVWAMFQDGLRGLGYIVGEGRVCASRFGVPQFRRRSITIAIRKTEELGAHWELPIPHGDPDNERSLSVAEAVGHLPPLEAGEHRRDIPNHVCRSLADVSKMRLLSVRPGEPNFGFNETPFGDLSLECHRRLPSGSKRGFGDVYTRMHPERPAPTITTRFHSVSNGRFGHYDPDQVRGLSLREGAALQSFTDDYVFHGNSMESIARMIGNAVPPKLSAYLSGWLLGLWEAAVGEEGRRAK